MSHTVPSPDQHPDVETLSALVDGELDAPTAHEVEGHLRTCRGCDEVRDGLLALRQGLDALGDPPNEDVGSSPSSPEPSPPERPRRRARRRGLVAALGGAAAAAVTFGLLVGPERPDEEPRRATSDSETLRFVVRDHREYAGRTEKLTRRTADPSTLSRWLRAEASIPFEVPKLEGAQLLGGRPCTILGRSLALVFYRYEGTWLSLYGIPVEGGESAEELMAGLPSGCVRARDDLSACAWQERDAVVALLGARPPEELRRLLARSGLRTPDGS